MEFTTVHKSINSLIPLNLKRRLQPSSPEIAPAFSPEHWNAVRHKHRVRRNHGHPVYLCLGQNHAVHRILVMHRQFTAAQQRLGP